MELTKRLAAYGQSGIYPMHMPGHKRNTALCSMPNPYGLDVTEVEGTDNLYEPQEVLLELQRQAARLWRVPESFLLINGSSGGLLAAIRAATREGDTVLVARNCHQSVYHALLLCRLKPVYLLPEAVEGFSFCGAVSPQTVEAAFQAHPEASAVILTSPTYEGVCSDLAAIAALVHRRGAVLVVDEAHGAHLGFAAGFPPSAVSQGADLVVQSLHKTLPVFTQTAILHRATDRVPREAVRRNLRIFGSSSPSYLLLASASQCFALLETRGAELFSAYGERLARFRADAQSWRHLRLLEAADLPTPLDPGKLLISCRGTTVTGVALARRLRETYRIETEMATLDTVLGMTSIADTEEGFLRFAAALKALDAALEPAAVPRTERLCPLQQVILPHEAEALPHEAVPLERAAGRICGELLRAYPPGIPAAVPGERLTREALDLLRRQAAAGISVIGSEGEFPRTVTVCKRIDERPKS